MKIRITLSFFFLFIVVGAMPASAQDPDIRVSLPPVFTFNYQDARAVAPVMDLELSYITGEDSAAVDQWRYALVEALIADPGIWVSTKYVFENYGTDLVQFDQPVWSDWQLWDDPEGLQPLHISGLDPLTPESDRKYYLLALQVKDVNGSRSTELDYAGAVHNFWICTDKTPALTIRETFLGEHFYTGVLGQANDDIAGGQELAFEWYGSAGEYGGAIASYRWGWDLSDPDNPLDPGWAVEPGLGPEHTASVPTQFMSGIHTLTVDCLDTSDQLTRVRWNVSVVPVPSLAERRPLLLIDDIPDRDSQGWPDVDCEPLDADGCRDDFWASVLDPVEGWDASEDVFDAEDSQSWGYRETVGYRTLLWTSRSGVQTYISQNFATAPGVKPYVWLEPFMEHVGNVFLVGSRAMQNFEPQGPAGMPWIYPVIYDTDESSMACGVLDYALGFGVREDAPEETTNLGTETYPYRAMGLSMTNIMAPGYFFVDEGVCGDNISNVRSRCAGTKALILDDAFAAANGWSYGVADTVHTWECADFCDDIDDLGMNWIFGANDEFYDTNVTTRATEWEPQTLPGGAPAVTPMWRAYTRYDWILDSQVAAGNVDYPGDLNISLPIYCGSWTVDPATGRTRTDGAPLGVLSHKTVATKPTGRPDVLWGFDPHRFDHEDMTFAIRQVLKGNFGLEVQGVVANEPDPDPDPEELPPTATRLMACYPNPFNPSTQMSFDLARPGAVSLRIVDVRGRHVADLIDESLAAGTYTAVWTGRDDSGRAVPAGVYFAQLIADDVRETRRMTLLK